MPKEKDPLPDFVGEQIKINTNQLKFNNKVIESFELYRKETKTHMKILTGLALGLTGAYLLFILALMFVV